ncbi:hypothetical protein JAAARDRAFT_198122 [Jaapia argillacea MUCL 33604]|uniref:Uncharacterized protein n=1 Tax=Jaapia argillacea MUCL 33604 TaxID=933084 RepID=A0A067PME1_9AGAM|nr:hypothetical protein JAAARDRAFT_198122 [Jaapia argillacea MUCL 33604]
MYPSHYSPWASSQHLVHNPSTSHPQRPFPNQNQQWDFGLPPHTPNVENHHVGQPWALSQAPANSLQEQVYTNFAVDPTTRNRTSPHCRAQHPQLDHSGNQNLPRLPALDFRQNSAPRCSDAWEGSVVSQEESMYLDEDEDKMPEKPASALAKSAGKGDGGRSKKDAAKSEVKKAESKKKAMGKGRELSGTEVDKLKAVHRENWTEADKLTVGHNFIKISQKLLEGKKTVEQVKNVWTQMWEKYKAVRRRSLHTGGGDGDETDGSEDLEPKEGEAAAADGTEKDGNGVAKVGERAGDERGTEKAKRKATKMPKTGENRKAGSSKLKTKQKHEGKFSNAVLDAFEQLVIFEMIDKVAHKNSDVVRSKVYNASHAVSDDEEDDDMGELLKSLVTDLRQRHLTNGQREDKRLKLMEKREDRELCLLERQDKREEREAEERKQELDEHRLEKAREHRTVLWDRAMKMAESSNAMIKKQGEELAAKLALEEEADGFN